jgi:hypothetical protein
MDPELELTTTRLKERGFVTELVTPPDQAHFGNWALIAVRYPLALRVTNDRGIVVDLMEGNAFQSGAGEAEWFNWDVVARALGIRVVSVVEIGVSSEKTDQLWAVFANEKAVVNAFSQAEWAKTRVLLHKVEKDKRREFMEGGRLHVPA